MKSMFPVRLCETIPPPTWSKDQTQWEKFIHLSLSDCKISLVVWNPQTKVSEPLNQVYVRIVVTITYTTNTTLQHRNRDNKQIHCPPLDIGLSRSRLWCTPIHLPRTDCNLCQDWVGCVCHNIEWEFVYYSSTTRKLNKRLICECRCCERLKAKDEGSTRLPYTGWWGGLEHLKIETRLINERFASVMVWSGRHRCAVDIQNNVMKS